MLTFLSKIICTYDALCLVLTSPSSINNAAVVACGRKKRAILDEVLGFADQAPVSIDADAPQDDAMALEDIVSGMDEASAER